MKVEFVPVWKQVTPDLAQELMAFWQASKAVVEPGAAATRRRCASPATEMARCAASPPRW